MTKQTIYLSDYAAPAYLIDDVHLTFHLDPHATRVIARIAFRPNPATTSRAFFLDGQHMTLISASIDGANVTPALTDQGLSLQVPDVSFIWRAETQISPATNSTLEGLYMSNGMYCSQCEAEGFRNITYYPDRPDVLAKFTVRIIGDAPVLLSNGNPTGRGDGWAEWHDPWPKPSYLFGLVAGDLVSHADKFTTVSGKIIDLNVWASPGHERKCSFAMDAVKLAMAWDEKVYGREYDLEVFNVVAVDDFNAGAMENKGLNIFNSNAVLASPQTATDANFERIEAIVAHEYFHNWTGNRVTCRDWFQLSLKEGLTVFRDQQFTSDMRSAGVKRIDDVIVLRGSQFREDAGPLAHPVRPESFVEINNFFTTTVYKKGAEVIRMLKLLVGDAAYTKALDLYFERHDGQAATVEDWLQVFQDTTGRDLDQFKRWYSQPGTPQLTIQDHYQDGTYTLNIKQENPVSASFGDTGPLLIPIAVGLLNPNGDEMMPTKVLEMTEIEQSFRFDGLSSRPIPSLLRGFSAPVILQRDTSDEIRAFLLTHDTDSFNKWQAGRELAKAAVARMLEANSAPETVYLDALAAALADTSLDPAFRSRLLQLPGNEEMARSLFAAGQVPDPTAIDLAIKRLKLAISDRSCKKLIEIYHQMSVSGPYHPDPKSAGKRRLRAAILNLVSASDGGDMAQTQFAAADNMTEQLGALDNLVPTGHGKRALADFYAQWRDDEQVVDIWFATQVRNAAPSVALAVAKKLTSHHKFNWQNPNRLRSVVNSLAFANQAAFHQSDGAGYRFTADWIIKVDPINPNVAAGLTNCFSTWRIFGPDRQDMIRQQLNRIAGRSKLSNDTREMVARLLGGTQ